MIITIFQISVIFYHIQVISDILEAFLYFDICHYTTNVFIDYKAGFSLKNNPKFLNPSHKTDFLERKKTIKYLMV